MRARQSNRIKKIEKIAVAFNRMQKLPKTLIRFGLYVFLAIYVTGTILLILNNTVFPYDSYVDMVSKELVKVSFILAAEAIIGSIVMDYVFPHHSS
ncbi:MAG TPA: hypothetical protein PLP87_07760 [Clostridiales bacterium]|nr:hypothetical protein [Clostridiales bacterium]